MRQKTDPKEAKKKVEDFASSLSADDIAERRQKIHELIKRIPKVVRDLEVESLDLTLFIISLASGKFPLDHLEDIRETLERNHTELGRIIKGWNELFDKEIEAKK